MARKNNVEDIEHELLGYLPRQFVLMYYELVERAFVGYTSPLGHAGESGGVAKKKFNTHNGGLRDEAALKEKQNIDRLLRSFVRDGGSKTKADAPKCSHCSKQLGATWLWCAWCGTSRDGGVIQDGVVRVEHRSADGQVLRVTPEPAIRAPRIR
ncbi:hypothetical protein PBI_QUASAR_66 [Gordonia phage Quasar]|nr:hypothetical protein PBI_QUASAR_66 [Gordonia phage Quasar]